MAHIVEFAIDGLAGHDAVYKKTLNKDVNVFYGQNGSGKTTLLKILHAAMDASTDALQQLPFHKADVVIYFQKYDSELRRSINQKQKGNAEKPISDQKWFEPHQTSLSLLGSFQPEWNWRSLPPEPGGSTQKWKHGYLPISRLYRGVSPSGNIRKNLSEEELDRAFAKNLQLLWSSYYTDIATSIQQIQERGLAGILEAVLSTSEEDASSDALDVKEAYGRIAGFLSRQPGFSGVLGTEAQFAKAYNHNIQLRKVVRHVEQVEKEFQAANAPREQLRQLVNSMFTGHKQVVFSDKEIRVRTEDSDDIGLPLLSSGEKQLLLVALECLITGNHVLLIDEPELSMHIDWQRKLIPLLMNLNPSMQLIVATHSPDIMADLPDHQIFKIWGD